MARLILILGGARSGKSRFAQQLAQRLGGNDVLFVATAEAGDAEMARRIEIHKNSRPATWETLEQPLGVGAALAHRSARCQIVLLDCLTLLVSNVLLSCGDAPDPNTAQRMVQAETSSLLRAIQALKGTVIVVSGEVGMGVVPETALGRLFRDLLGWANQTLAEKAGATYWMVAGLPVEIHSLATTVEQAATECRRAQDETH